MMEQSDDRISKYLLKQNILKTFGILHDFGINIYWTYQVSCFIIIVVILVMMMMY